jgi:LacI family transcriptional regulator
VPGDISVTGIDDTRPAHLVGLTTVTVPLHEMGRRAAHAILDGSIEDVVLPHALAIRNTTR